MKKILYIAYARMPTEKAHGVQIANTCAALAGRGYDVELVVPERKNPITEDLFIYYSLPRSFLVTRVPAPRASFAGPLRFLFGEAAFGRSLRSRVGRYDAVLTRSALTAFFLGTKAPVFFEVHDLPRSFFLWKILLRRCRGLISTNEWKAKCLRDLLGFSEDRILVAQNGYRAEFFSDKHREEIREAIDLPRDASIALYAGSLFGWKGADLLARVARTLPGTLFVFVAGSDEEGFKKRYGGFPNIRIVPRQKNARVALYLEAADMLVLPNSAATEESRRGTSPIKLFEYMASGTPIIAASLPSVREIVDERTALFFKPDDEDSLRGALAEVQQRGGEARARAAQAKDSARQYTWDARAERVGLFIETRLTHP